MRLRVFEERPEHGTAWVKIIRNCGATGNSWALVLNAAAMREFKMELGQFYVLEHDTKKQRVTITRSKPRTGVKLLQHGSTYAGKLSFGTILNDPEKGLQDLVLPFRAEPVREGKAIVFSVRQSPEAAAAQKAANKKLARKRAAAPVEVAVKAPKKKTAKKKAARKPREATPVIETAEPEPVLA